MIFVISDLSPRVFRISGGNFQGTLAPYDSAIEHFAYIEPVKDAAMMTIEQICQAMDQNRRTFDWDATQIQLNQLCVGERRRQLADTWIEAMQRHYQLLWDYLQLRELATKFDARASAQLNADQLRAPRRPNELPESLSRYVTTAEHAELLI